MNDFIFLVVVENLKPTDDLPPESTAWFSFVPQPVRQSVIAAVSQRFGVLEAEAPFLITRALTGIAFLALACWFAWRAVRRSDIASFCEAGFLTLAWFWLLCPTQNPWYWTWALPLLPFARGRAWLAVSGLVLQVLFHHCTLIVAALLADVSLGDFADDAIAGKVVQHAIDHAITLGPIL